MNNTMVLIANAIETNDICSTGISVVAVFSQQKLMWSCENVSKPPCYILRQHSKWKFSSVLAIEHLLCSSLFGKTQKKFSYKHVKKQHFEMHQVFPVVFYGLGLLRYITSSRPSQLDSTTNRQFKQTLTNFRQ